MRNPNEAVAQHLAFHIRFRKFLKAIYFEVLSLDPYPCRKTSSSVGVCAEATRRKWTLLAYPAGRAYWPSNSFMVTSKGLDGLYTRRQ